LSPSPDVPVFSCAVVGPAAAVVITAVEIPGMLAVDIISAVAVVPSVVDVSFGVI
jgi:hypothetical protein